MAEPDAAGSAGLSVKERDEMLAKLRDLLRQLEELEPRLAAASSPEVEMSLLERATEQVEEAGRLLERLGRVAG